MPTARGIRNLGNRSVLSLVHPWVPSGQEALADAEIALHSCYMSVVLQTFLMNPFLRAYFLSDRHNRSACSRTLAGEACLSCELDLLFSEVSFRLLSSTGSCGPWP